MTIYNHPRSTSSHGRQEGSAPDFGSCRSHVDFTGCCRMSLLLLHPPDVCAPMVVAAFWWCVCCGFFFLFFPSLAQISRIFGAAKAFFFFPPEFMHWLAEGSLEACQRHLAMHSVNYSSEKNVRCWEGVIRLYWCIHFGGQTLLLTHSGMTWHLFTLTRCRGGNDELPGLAAHEDTTPKLLLSTEGTHRVVWAGRDP